MDDATARVEAAVRACPRVDFLPSGARHRAGDDSPVAIGHGQTCSQPRTVVDMLVLLDARPGDHVLDVGAGSGWTTALLGHLVGPGGRVRGVERIPALTRTAKEHVTAVGMPWATVEQAEPGVLGLPAHGPYDRILVSAQARGLPDELVDQLAEGGRMVIPVDGFLRLVRRTADGVETSRLGAYRFVPLQHS